MALKPVAELIGITVADAAEYLGVDGPTAGQETALQRLSRSAVEHVSLYLNRGFPEELPVPAAIEEACFRMLADLYEGAPKPGSEAERHIKSVSVDSVRYEYEASQKSTITFGADGSMSPPVLSLLRPYRFPPGL